MLNRHHRFFSSSLKQVEGRLASEREPRQEKRKDDDGSRGHDPSLIPNDDDGRYDSPEQLTSSPLVFNDDHHHPNVQGSDSDAEAPPPEFLSSRSNSSSAIPQTNDEDVDRLMCLLGLSDLQEDREEEEASETCVGCHCCCSSDDGGGGFHGMVMEGVRRRKGWRCGQERRRLDGWIRYYRYHHRDGGENREPARLAHLLLAKALCLSRQHEGEEEEESLHHCQQLQEEHEDRQKKSGENLDFGEMEFPSTVYEFLKYDPPH